MLPAAMPALQLACTLCCRRPLRRRIALLSGASACKGHMQIAAHAHPCIAGRCTRSRTILRSGRDQGSHLRCCVCWCAILFTLLLPLLLSQRLQLQVGPPAVDIAVVAGCAPAGAANG